MTHPIVALQAPLVEALRASGAAPVFDAPPLGQSPPCVALARHDVVPRDGDGMPGHEHRILLYIWAPEPSRKSALVIAEAITSAALGTDLSTTEMLVTLARHDRTESSISSTLF